MLALIIEPDVGNLICFELEPYPFSFKRWRDMFADNFIDSSFRRLRVGVWQPYISYDCYIAINIRRHLIVAGIKSYSVGEHRIARPLRVRKAMELIEKVKWQHDAKQAAREHSHADHGPVITSGVCIWMRFRKQLLHNQVFRNDGCKVVRNSEFLN